MIGLGGLKYYLLKVDPKKRMMFNPEESIELNGNTGPFIQYAYARIQSLLRKGSIEKHGENLDILEEEREIIKLLMDAPKVLEEASKNLAPSVIANYLYELVKTYNHFYQNVKILNEENAELISMRLKISDNVAKVIRNYFKLLGIRVPAKM
jgi:arginyl-tRNA synthetase